jgi:hypothetical protein
MFYITGHHVTLVFGRLRESCPWVGEGWWQFFAVDCWSTHIVGDVMQWSTISPPPHALPTLNLLAAPLTADVLSYWNQNPHPWRVHSTSVCDLYQVTLPLYSGPIEQNLTAVLFPKHLWYLSSPAKLACWVAPQQFSTSNCHALWIILCTLVLQF